MKELINGASPNQDTLAGEAIYRRFTLNIGFIIDPWDSLNPETDSTLRLIHEARRRGHNVGIISPWNLTVRDNVTYGLFSMLEKEEKVPGRISTFYSKTKIKKQRLPVKGFDVLIIRKDPPVDWLMLNFLDSVKDDTLIINSVEGLRMANNKLYLTTFEESHEYIPETYVSKDKDYLLEVIQQSKMDRFILKPLDGFGGSGVILLEKAAMSNVRSILEFYIESGQNRNYVILQEFIESDEKGDVRVLMLNGMPVGSMKRIPKENEFRANVHVGGKVTKHNLTKTQIDVCKIIGPKLVNDGLFFAGIDFIGDKLIEINVLSPGGIVNINRLNKVKIERMFMDVLDETYRKREAAFLRKLAYKKEVGGA